MCKVALSLETYGLTVQAQQTYLDLIGKEQRGAGAVNVSQEELETWEVISCLRINIHIFIYIFIFCALLVVNKMTFAASPDPEPGWWLKTLDGPMCSKYLVISAGTATLVRVTFAWARRD